MFDAPPSLSYPPLDPFNTHALHDALPSDFPYSSMNNRLPSLDPRHPAAGFVPDHLTHSALPLRRERERRRSFSGEDEFYGMDRYDERERYDWERDRPAQRGEERYRRGQDYEYDDRARPAWDYDYGDRREGRPRYDPRYESRWEEDFGRGYY